MTSPSPAVDINADFEMDDIDDLPDPDMPSVPLDEVKKMLEDRDNVLQELLRSVADIKATLRQAPTQSQKGTPDTASTPSEPDATPDRHSNMNLNSRPPMKATVHPPKPFDGKPGSDVEHFLRKMKQYLHLCQVPSEEQLDFAAQYLEGQPDKLWYTEKDVIALTKSEALNWSDFENFLQRAFGKIAPMTDYFKEYEDLRQETTVIDYVSRMRTCVNKLKGSFLEPSEGTICVKFLRGLKPMIAKLVQNAAPDGWFTSVDQVYAKALTFETNKAAMMDSLHDVGKPTTEKKETTIPVKRKESPNASTSKFDLKKKKKGMSNPTKDVHIPRDEWVRRLKNKRCVMCGKPRHGECSDKVATPFKD